jgi:hypothetical protein
MRKGQIVPVVSCWHSSLFYSRPERIQWKRRKVKQISQAWHVPMQDGNDGKREIPVSTNENETQRQSMCQRRAA